jgi:hypothetical protein
MNSKLNTNEIQNRKKIYNQIIKEKKINNINGLFYYSKLPNYEDLKSSVENYLSENILISFNKKYINLNKSKNFILKLQNVTPNGIVHPIERTSIVYNSLVKKIFESIDIILPYLESAAMPIVRVKKSEKNRNKIKRPYATTKLHSDAWVGQYGDAIISIGIDGDIKRNGVEFFLPNRTTNDFFKKIQNYDEGLTKFDDVKKIKNLSKGEWCLFDHAVLHKTMNNMNTKPRISVDIAVKIKSKNKRKVKYADKKRFNYFPIQNYLKLGIKNFIKIKRKKTNKKTITIQEFCSLK